MKNKVFLIILFFTAFYGYGEDIYFRVIRDTPYWLNISFPMRKNISGYIEKDTIVTHTNDATPIDSGFGIPDEEEEIRFMQTVFYEKERLGKVLVASEDLVPVESVDLFDESFIRGLNEFWVLDVYLKALAARNRNVIWEAHPSVWREYQIKLPGIYPLSDYEWWERIFFPDQKISYLYVIQTGIYMEISPFFSRTLFIKNIVRLDNGYKVTVKNEEEPKYLYNTPWHSLPKGFIDLILIHDGDYFDIFLAENNSHFATFVRVDKSILNELYSLTETNTCDLSKITFWPRRADGSMDYPQPVVPTAPGNTQREKQPELIELSVDSYDMENADTENQQNETDQNSAKKSAMPLWAWFAIIGASVAVAGGVVFAVKRRK